MHLKALCKGPVLPCGERRLLTKTLLIMNFTAILLTVTCLQVGARGIAQNITLSEKNVPLQKVFKSIEDQTGYVFFFNYAWLRHARKVSVEARNASLMEALELCFKDQPLTYEIVNRTIVLKPKTPVAGRVGSLRLFTAITLPARSATPRIGESFSTMSAPLGERLS